MDGRAYRMKLRNKAIKKYIKGKKPSKLEISAFATGFNMAYNIVRKLYIKKLKSSNKKEKK